MNFTELSFKQPKLFFSCFALIMLLGAVCFLLLPVQLLPNIEEPQISISSSWNSASPSDMEKEVAEPIERLLNNMPDLKDLSTYISKGSVEITLTFPSNIDLSQKFIEVASRLNMVDSFPADATQPMVRIGGNSGATVLASITVRKVDQNQTFDIIKHQQAIDSLIQNRFLSIPGISYVDYTFKRKTQLNIRYDARKIASLGITIGEVFDAISNNSDTASGYKRIGKNSYSIKYNGEPDLQEFGDIIVKKRNDAFIKLSDIASIKLEPSQKIGASYRNGQRSYYFTLHRSYSSNTLSLLEKVKAEIEYINRVNLSDLGLIMELSFDASLHIKNAVKFVLENLVLGISILLLSLLFFFKRKKYILLIVSTLPISVLACFFTLELLDLSLNVISIAGIALSIGVAIDSAVIVQEYLIQNPSLISRQTKKIKLVVTKALVSSAATSIIVLVPILFLSGKEANLFRDMVVTITVTIMVSLFAAITLVPLLNRYFAVRPELERDPVSSYITRKSISVFRLFYRSKIGVLVFFGVVSISLYFALPSINLLPKVPTGGFFFSLPQPAGTSIEYVESELFSTINSRMAPYLSGDKQPKISSVNMYSLNGSNTGGFIYSDNPAETQRLMDVARNEIFKDIPDTPVYLFRGSMLNFNGGTNSDAVVFNVHSSTLESAGSIAEQFIERLKSTFPNSQVQSFPELKASSPEIIFEPKVRSIYTSGFNVADVGNLVRSLASGLFVRKYFAGNDTYDVYIISDTWTSISDLKLMPIYTPYQGVQYLNNLAGVDETIGPNEILRVGGKRSIAISLYLENSQSVEEVIQKVEAEVIPKMGKQFEYSFSGQASDFKKIKSDFFAIGCIALTVLLGLVAWVYKSIKLSMIVASIIPVSILGGLSSLKLASLFISQELDLITLIGFVIMLGIVVNSSILFSDNCKHNYDLGFSINESIEKSLKIRMRPMLISAITSCFGMLPLIFMPGEGAEIYRGLAIVIASGIFFGGLYCVFVLPSLLSISYNKFSTAKELKIEQAVS